MKIASSDGSATSKWMHLRPAGERRGQHVPGFDAGPELELGEAGGPGGAPATPGSSREPGRRDLALDAEAERPRAPLARFSSRSVPPATSRP